MKKFFLFLLVFILSLSLICLAVAADPLVREQNVDTFDSGSLRSVPDDSSGYPCPYVFASSLSFSTHVDWHVAGVLSCNGESYNGFYWSDNSELRFFTPSSSVTVYSSGSWVDDSYRYITLNVEPPGNALRFLNANDYYRLLPNVTSAIGFSGEVLTFITSSPGILALVGLSIAFAIIPFAVRKVKELIKGY